MASWVLCGHAVCGTTDGATGPFKAPHSGTATITGTPDLYLVCVGGYSALGAPAAGNDLSDSHGNVYAGTGNVFAAGDANVWLQWFYKFAPTTGGTEVWTQISSVGYSEEYVGLAALAFSGSDGTTAPSTAHSNATSSPTGSASLGTSGQLVVAASTGYNFDVSAIAASFTIVDHQPYVNANNAQIGSAWNGSSAGVGGAVDPAWTLTAAPTAVVSYNLAFTPSGGGGGFTAKFRKTLSGLGAHVGGRQRHA